MASIYGDQFSTDRYKCKLCAKWKPVANFSSRELKNYRLKAATGAQIDGASAQIRCVNCADDQRQELECRGPCGKKLGLMAFSKASRKAGGNKWCQECTNWKESAEPDVVVGPAPQTELAPDEALSGNQEVGNEADEGNVVEEQPQQTNPDTWYTRSGFADTFSGSIAPASVTYGAAEQTELDIKNKGKERARAPADDDIDSVSSASNLYEDLATIDLGGDWEATDARRREPITFNAYDSKGQLHRRQQTPSASETGRSSSTVRGPGINTFDNPRKFAKPAGTRNPPPKMTYDFSGSSAAGTIPRSRAVYSIEDDSDGDY
ncbi:uncharacterized protein BP5553_03351 [Venustampulla echinocandica]|uniref:Stc1 domain-containing protein n=1 Tax=Venustampulla echinocandica TaxID=2656787 RepID=A0A370TU09_9HELO|nr:uncharacterized protein BP5553_03351 [Venustampulla echinocandica]RDL39011.1 hypothetical protein BP5553_03351 [Venustampulla echinocandica]